MEQVTTVIVRDRDHIVRLRPLDDWAMTTLIGAISADPRDLHELEDAWRRYSTDPCLAEGAMAFHDMHEEGPWLVLDLACQRLLAGGGEELPENLATYQRDEGKWHRGMPLVWINLPPHWTMVPNADWGQALPPMPLFTEPLDFRGVLYGRALAADIAHRTLKIARLEPIPSRAVFWDDLPYGTPEMDTYRESAKRWHELTVRVHAAWLMTPRGDLEGESPRPFLHRGRAWVERDMDNRQVQWTHEGRSPRGLSRDSFAFRYGPPGLNEVVVYFELCREVIAEAWRKNVADPEIHEKELIDTLYHHMQHWLREGSIDGDPTAPAEIITSERQRIPLTSDPSTFDDDCPICRMLAEESASMGSPMFSNFDGHHLELDDEFAFSLCETREEWQMQQNSYSPMHGTTEQEDRLENTRDDAAEYASAWTASYVSDNVPTSAMSLAFRLAEIVGDMQTAGETKDQIRDLNDAFDTCRNITHESSQFQPAKATLIDMLESVAIHLPELTPKIADFESQLDAWARNKQMI